MVTVDLTPVSLSTARVACQSYHYSGTIPDGTAHRYGVIEHDGDTHRYIGVIALGTPATPARYQMARHQVLELKRIALGPHACAVTQVIAAAIKRIRQDAPQVELLVSYADPAQGHHGGVYQAASWIYTGTTKPDYQYLIDGKWWHSRSVSRLAGARLPEKVSAILGTPVERVKVPGKHKYVFPLSRRARKLVTPLALPYPKEEVMEGKGAYTTMDAVEFMDTLPRGAISGVATSPPYNKAFKNRGRTATRRSTNWVNSKIMAENYNGYDDALPEDEFIQWQRRFLESALAAVGDGGVILYNMGRRIKNLEEDHRRAIVEGFPVRQTIIWNRGSSNNLGGKRPTLLPPRYELIYLIAGKDWRVPVRWVGEARRWGDVWDIPFETNNPHPAPFPVALAERMIKLVDGLVVDPFAGSGTVGVAAQKLGYPYLLNDKCTEYRDMFYRRIDKEV